MLYPLCVSFNQLFIFLSPLFLICELFCSYLMYRSVLFCHVCLCYIISLKYKKECVEAYHRVVFLITAKTNCNIYVMWGFTLSLLPATGRSEFTVRHRPVVHNLFFLVSPFICPWGAFREALRCSSQWRPISQTSRPQSHTPLHLETLSHCLWVYYFP